MAGDNKHVAFVVGVHESDTSDSLYARFAVDTLIGCLVYAGSEVRGH